MLSERSIESDHVSREVGLAVQAGKPVLPVRIERVMLTGSLARAYASPGPTYDPEGRRPDDWRVARALRPAGRLSM